MNYKIPTEVPCAKFTCAIPQVAWAQVAVYNLAGRTLWCPRAVPVTVTAVRLVPPGAVQCTPTPLRSSLGLAACRSHGVGLERQVSASVIGHLSPVDAPGRAAHAFLMLSWCVSLGRTLFAVMGKDFALMSTL